MSLTKHLPMTESERRTLDRDGCIRLDNFMSADLLARLRERVDELFAQEGDQAGSEFKQEPQSRRLANLVNKGEVFTEMIGMPAILERVANVIGAEFKLSSLNARSANPHSDWVQPLHADAGAIADEKGYWVLNTVWLLDDFTPENGAIRMVPGSHRWGKLPQQILADPDGRASVRSAAHRQSGLRAGDERPPVARRNSQPNARAPPRRARLLHALGQAAAAVSEEAFIARRAASAEPGTS